MYLKSLGLILFLAAMHANAVDSYRQFTVQHRDAQTLAGLLSDWVSAQVAVTAEGDRLLLRGPANELDSLMTVVKSLDRPLKQLQVTVYRGSQPDIPTKTSTSQRWTTHAGVSTTDQLMVEEGSVFEITRESIRLLPAGQSLAAGEYNGEKGDARWREESNSLSPVASQEGVELRLTILPDNQVAASIAIWRKMEKNTSKEPKDPQGNDTITTHITRLKRQLPVGQWVSVVEQSRQSYRPGLSERRHIVSTNKRGEDLALWLYIAPLK